MSSSSSPSSLFALSPLSPLPSRVRLTLLIVAAFTFAPLAAAWAQSVNPKVFATTQERQAGSTTATADADADASAESRFVRFIGDGTAGGTLETADVIFKNDRGVTIRLVSAVHIGEESYFQ